MFNPNDPEALNPALAEAAAPGIKTVSVDAFVTDPDTYNLYNNQIKYAEIGARWLFEQLGGKGNVWYTRGIAGNPADSDRDIGIQERAQGYPNIKIVPNADGVFTEWDPATATQVTNDFLASGQYDDDPGHLDVGHGQADHRRDQGREQAVRADRRCRRRWLRDADARPHGLPRSEGRGRDQHRRRRRRGRHAGAQAAQRRDRRDLARRAAAEHGPARPGPRRQPDRRRQGAAAGLAVGRGLDPLWPLGLPIDGWTTYTPEQAVACKGPGE